MAHDSLGTHNQPHYSGTGAPSDAADLSEVSDYAALVGNAKSGTTALMNALSGADLWAGLVFSNTTDSGLYVYSGTAWVRVAAVAASAFAEAAGQFAITAAAGGSAAPVYWSGTQTVTFPTGRFSVAPLVTVTPQDGAAVMLGATVQTVSATGFTFIVNRATAAPAAGQLVNWTAVQMTATTAAG